MPDVNESLEIGRKLRAARLKQELSLRDLAARAEVSASLLSQIETAKANPSVRSLHSIADALNLPITYFFPQEKEKRSASDQTDPTSIASADRETAVPSDQPLIHQLLDNMTPSDVRSAQAKSKVDDFMELVERESEVGKGPVVRRGQHQTIELQGGVVWSRLTPGPEANAEYLLIRYDVGATSGQRMSHHTGREFTYVLNGRLRLDLGFEHYILEPGDSVIFDSTTPHRLTNVGEIPMLAITVIFKPKVVDA